MNIQKKLLKVRPPRVRITYQVDSENGLEKKELPFVIAVIANLQGDKKRQNSHHHHKFVELTQDNFSSVMQSIKPELSIKVRNYLTFDSQEKVRGQNDKLLLKLDFVSMQSFRPDAIVELSEFAEVLQDRRYLVDLISKIDSDQYLKEELIELLNQNLANGNQEKAESEGSDKRKEAVQTESKEKSTNEKSSSRSKKDKSRLSKEDAIRLSREYFGSENRIEMLMVLQRLQGEIRDLHGAIMQAIAEIDSALSAQIDEILHHPEFQALEASWCGLYELVHQLELSEHLKVRFLNYSIAELEKDLLESSEFDQSHLFKLIYEEEYGTIGGLPFSCIIADFFFDKSETDVKLLHFLSSVAAAAHAPLMVGTKPSMFNLRSFMNLHFPRDLKTIFDSSDAIHWNNFRDTESARYVSLFLPYILMRVPYGKSNPIKAFNYTETVDGEQNENFCWGNPAYFMGIKLGEAMAKYGWAAAIRGPEGGGLVRNLPAYTFKTSFGDICMKCPTQTHITDRREKELSDLGFIALCHKKMTNEAVFFSGQTAQRAKKYRSEEMDASASLSSKMPYMLNASRFAHYIKVIMRDKIGSFQSSKNVESYLQAWIAEYVLLSDGATQEMKAEYPLREAQIKVQESEMLGEYSVTLNMRPHFQMEGLNVCLRFVAKILSGD